MELFQRALIPQSQQHPAFLGSHWAPPLGEATSLRTLSANLQSLQAEADNKIAQARAEERRAMAVALEQEMRAAVVEAEAEVPRAMAEALRNGSMGVMDYYRLQNVQADTQMKKEIGKGVDNYTSRKPDNKLGPVSTPEN